MNSSHSIIPGRCGDVVWFHVKGAGSRENSADVAGYAQPEIAGGKQRFVVDLAECTSLDSTFMGMLIGLAQQVKHDVEGCLHVINASGRNAQLLRGLGVHYFCNVSEDDGPFAQRKPGSEACGCAEAAGPTRSDVVYAEQLEHLDLSKKELTEHCLDAHTKLCEAGKENKDKFQHVVELMEQKLMQLQQ